MVATTAALALALAASAGATTWSAPHALFPSAVTAYRSSATMNADGDVAAVTISADQRDVVLYERPAGGPETTTVVGSDTTRAGDPQVALSDTGAIAVAWVGADNDEAHVAVRPAGSSTFRAPVDISSTTYQDGMNDTGNVRIGIDDAGEVAVAWKTGTSSPWTMHWGLIGTSGTLGTTGTVTAGWSLAFSVSMNGAGDAVVGWSEVATDPAQSALRASVRPAGGVFGTPADVHDGVPDFEPSTAIDAAGDVAVAYTGSAGNHGEIRVATMPAGGAFGTPVAVSAPGDDTAYPSVAMAGDGTAVVSWSPGFIGRYAARAVTLAGTPVGAVTTLGPSPNSRSRTVLRPDGSGAVFMLATDGLYVAKRDADGTFEPATLVTTGGYSSGVNMPGAVGGIDAAGDMAMFWPGSSSSVSLSYYDLGAPQLGSVTVPATGTSGTPLAFSGTASDALSWGTVRWDFGDGHTADGDAVSHTYAAGGTYTVTATGIDASGNTDPATETRTVVVAQAPPPPSTGDADPGTGTTTTTTQTPVTTTTTATSPAPAPSPAPVTPKPAPPARPAAVTCKVPSLAGLTTAAARRKLAAAHCRLGTVTTPKKYKKTKGLVIRKQSRRSGARLASGTKVSVTLGPKVKAKAANQ
ncbi:PKD domain-containing protein [Conexibacter woesei]|uniref:PKD domain-containing protein n=1 Tax=Conexibacter woesei TaxID=191495 RepID=UPI00040683C9|nr:PKD domain-containing protein [Conexibacter woesei]